MAYKAIGGKLEEAVKGFKLSFFLSLAGTVAELFVVLLTYNIILLVDLVHWFADTVLEGLFLVALVRASRIYRRFPLGVLILESTLVTVAILVILGVYGYFFISYFMSYGRGLSGYYHPALALITLVGALLTAVIMGFQKKRYEETKLEVLRVDYVHALIDMVAAVLATTGVLLVSFTSNPGYEAMFTTILSIFVFHSTFEVLSDTFKTIVGKNTAPELKAKVLERVLDQVKDVRIRNVDVRKVGSFYIVSVHVEVDPRTTIKEAYAIRRALVDTIREVSELIYHVDVYIAPAWRRPKSRSRHSA